MSERKAFSLDDEERAVSTFEKPQKLKNTDSLDSYV